MNQDLVIKLFQFAILLFALSLHEASHAWMASRLGDQTARMLGRVTLNPAKHIDPVGTILIPLSMLFMPGFGRFLIGWAKPTPVNTRNFKNLRRDDVLTTLAGPCSNLLAAIVCSLVLILLEATSSAGKLSVIVAVFTANHIPVPVEGTLPALFPLALLLYLGFIVNLLLAIFNLLPLPPLDGSHIFRHMLPYNALRVYDSLGLISLILILFVGGRVVGLFMNPAVDALNRVLLSL
ncbi:MAG TPA: site-2 protease family protein [Acidisarcina sp.]|nr:site-2 protease family protein [Acidisarcina sp.]